MTLIFDLDLLHIAAWSQLRTVLHKTSKPCHVEQQSWWRILIFATSLKTYNVFEYTNRIITQHNNIELKEPIAKKITLVVPCDAICQNWFNIRMLSYQYRKSHYGEKTILQPSYLYNGISYTGKTVSLYWIGPVVNMDSGYSYWDYLPFTWAQILSKDINT